MGTSTSVFSNKFKAPQGWMIGSPLLKDITQHANNSLTIITAEQILKVLNVQVSWPFPKRIYY